MNHRRFCLCVVGCTLVSLLPAGCRPASTAGGGKVGSGLVQEDPRDLARTYLTQSPDITSCRTSLRQLNTYIGDHPEKRPTPLSSQAGEILTKEFGLTPDELKEVETNSFLPLDASYLEACCLVRDALSTMPIDGLSPLQRATIGFDWVIRQVRWEETATRIVLPADFVLRRGWGSAMERALAYLAVVDQLGLEGALLWVTPASGPARFWACGVLVDKEIFLFDPRLGLPLPGPNGAGVATLKQAREQAGVLSQLTVDAKSPYDVTQEQARRAEIHLACSLTSLAPRMKVLEEDLLGPSVRVKLWIDVEKRMLRCKELAGSTTTVAVAKQAVVAQRLFLPPADGGVDTNKIRDQVTRNIVPLPYLPEEIHRLEGQLGQTMFSAFGDNFLNLHLNHGKSRDQELRGRFDDALPVLTTIHEVTPDHRLKMLADQELGTKLRAWHKDALEAHAMLINAEQADKRGQHSDVEAAKQRVNQVWKNGEETLMTIIKGFAAEPLGQQATYLLALCMHEQAVRLQIRLERAPGEEKENLQQQARTAWSDAKSWWDSVVDDPPRLGMAGTRSHIVSARLLRAQAYAAFGDRASAENFLRDTSNLKEELEKIAFQYRAAQFSAKKKP